MEQKGVEMSNAMQIEEMAQDLSQVQSFGVVIIESQMDSRNSYEKPTTNEDVAKHLCAAGYRKQSEPISCGHEKGSGWISVDERLQMTMVA